MVIVRCPSIVSYTQGPGKNFTFATESLNTPLAVCDNPWLPFPIRLRQTVERCLLGFAASWLFKEVPLFKTQPGFPEYNARTT